MKRREFIKSAAAAGAAPLLFNGCATGFVANRKVNVGVIGYGRIASTFEVPHVLKRPDLARIVAICDLDRKRAHFGRLTVEHAYNDGAKVAVYTDYKELCAREDIDAVMICLPDFWHALVATTAICSGKAVWLQKPFTQTIAEGRLLANLAKKYGTVMQVGSQQRSWNQFQAVCAAVQAGVLGDVKRVEVGIGLDRAGGNRWAEPVPATFDYETWLGPTDHDVPYNWTRCHNDDLRHIADRPGWIQLAPYGWGMITNWGAHHLDIAQWGLDMDESGPVKAICSDEPHSTDLYHGGRRQYGMKMIFKKPYGDVELYHGPFGVWGTVFYGTDGIVAVNRGKIAVWKGTGLVKPTKEIRKALENASFMSDKIVAVSIGEDYGTDATVKKDTGLDAAINKLNKQFDLASAKVQLYKSPNQVQNFCECIETRKMTISPAEVGARGAVLCQICNMSYVYDSGFDWNPKSFTFANGTGDESWLKRPYYRNGWNIVV